MTDKEKVIKGLECHTECNCVECPYRDGWRTCPFGETLLADALNLLKEQEAVRPVKQIEQTEWTVCGNCRNHIISKWIFCPYCGKPVKWE